MINKVVGLKVLILPLSLAIVVILAVLFVKPAFSEMTKYKKAAEENRQQLSDLQKQSQELTELKKSWQSMEEREIIDVALPENGATEDYLAELYQRASRSGILINNLKSSEAASSSGPSYSCSGLSAMQLAAASGSAGVSTGMSSGSGALSETGATGQALLGQPCVEIITLEIGVSGSWDQILDFFKYLADSNRIANTRKVSISSMAGQSSAGESNPDLLRCSISIDAYFKPKSQTSDAGVIGALASGAGFNKEILEKMKESIYSPYEAPVVSETGERNIFK